MATARPNRTTTFIAAALLVAATTAPLLYGVAATPPGKVFLWNTRLNAQDQAAYLAWIQQGRDGHLLFYDQFTTEPNHRKLFMPLFLVTGFFSRLTGLSPSLAWLVVRIVLVFSLPLALMRFIRRLDLPVEQHGIALALMLLSSGLGWAVEGAGLPSADIGIPEAITFASAYQVPLFVASLILLVTALGPLYQRDVPRFGEILFAATASFVLAWVHPYDAASSALIATLILAVRSRNRDRLGESLRLVVIPLAAALPLAVQAIILRSEPVFRVWSETIPGLSPAPSGYLLGYGFLVPLAGLCIARMARVRRELLIALGAWILVTAALLYVPVSYQRRFVHGLHIPLCVLAAVGCESILRPFPARIKPWAMAVILIALVPTNVSMIAKDVKAYAAGGAPHYLRTEYRDAFDWLRANTNAEETVFSTLPSGNFIAAYGGNRVFVGHPDLTLFAEHKKSLAIAFFRSNDDDAGKRRLLAETATRYLYWSDVERSCGTYNPEEKDYLELVYRNPRVQIYRVRS